MINIIVALVLVVIVALAAAYVVNSRKKGKKCIGCPSGGDCSKCGSHIDDADN